MKKSKLAIAVLLLIVSAFSAAGCGFGGKPDYDALIENFVPNGLNTVELEVGQEYKPQEADIWLTGGKGDAYTSDANVAEITDMGKVTAVGEGTAYIIISASKDVSTVTQVTVTLPAKEADLSSLPEIEGFDFKSEIENFVPSMTNSYELKVGEKNVPFGADMANSPEFYLSSDSVISVADNAAVTAIGKGCVYLVVRDTLFNKFSIFKYTVK